MKRTHIQVYTNQTALAYLQVHMQQHNIRWFTYLVPGDDGKKKQYNVLKSNYSQDELNRKIVVRRETSFRGKTEMKYAVFNTHIDLYNYMKTTDLSDECLHEVIMSGKFQKPRFDIDIKEKDMLNDEKLKFWLSDVDSGEDPLIVFAHHVKDCVIEATIQVLIRDDLSLDLTKDVVVCSSHGDSSSGRKMSYHIIINGYMHSGEDEAKAFFEEVLKELAEMGELDTINRYIDHGVYGKNHNLRLLWNRKLGDKRVKRLELDYTYQGEVYTHRLPVKHINEDHYNIMMLESTMVTFTSYCNMLPPYIDPAKKAWDESISMTDKQTQDAMDLLKKALNEIGQPSADKTNSKRINTFEMEYQPDIPFTYKSNKGTLVVLKRVKPSYCSVCNEVHETVDPFMFIVNGDVYLDCRRSEDHIGKKKRLYLGKIEWDATQNINLRDIHMDLKATACTAEENSLWENLEDEAKKADDKRVDDKRVDDKKEDKPQQPLYTETGRYIHEPIAGRVVQQVNMPALTYITPISSGNMPRPVIPVMPSKLVPSTIESPKPVSPISLINMRGNTSAFNIPTMSVSDEVRMLSLSDNVWRNAKKNGADTLPRITPIKPIAKEGKYPGFM